jgi:hypothetical protein
MSETKTEPPPTLLDVFRSIIAKHENTDVVNPRWMATQAMTEIKFPRSLHEIGFSGCHAHFTQMFRSHLRGQSGKRFEADLFPDTLQKRYPRKQLTADGEAEYVLRDRMTEEDANYNIDRLTKEGGAKLRHADALRSWAHGRFGRDSVTA